MLRGALMVGLSFFLAAGCAEPPKQEPFQVSIKVESDPGRPMPGASISRANKPLGQTGADGRVSLKIGGIDGEFTDVTVTCPEGFSNPVKPLSVKLTRLADKTKVTEYGVSCPPSMRRVVVAVRAENGPNLPVEFLGVTRTRTDAGGAASFAFEIPPGSQFTVSLKTEDRHDIKPISPSKLFVVNNQDEVFLFDQKFDVEHKAAPKKQQVVVAKHLGGG